MLDVDLVHTLSHDSVVCCVRFSHDGRYVATGCNRSAQIFEVGSGAQVTRLQDETVDKEGDLYIRSVCFSPDGKFLATGAEDKQIRVCCDVPPRECKTNVGTRFGILPLAPSEIPSLAMSKTSIHLILREMESTLRLVAEIDQCVCGTLTVVVRS